jgi:GTPase SAR1 family protein
MEKLLRDNNIHSRHDRYRLNKLLIDDYGYSPDASKKYDDNLKYLKSVIDRFQPTPDQILFREVWKHLTKGKQCCGICGDERCLSSVKNVYGERMLMCKDCINIQLNM